MAGREKISHGIDRFITTINSPTEIRERPGKPEDMGLSLGPPLTFAANQSSHL